MENLGNFRNEFKKCESIENLFEREWCYAIQTEKKMQIFLKLSTLSWQELSEKVTETASQIQYRQNYDVL